MRALALLVVAAGCYAPHAATGAPCDPNQPVCPEGQTCIAVGGGHACSDGSPLDDAHLDDGGRADTLAMTDARADAAVPVWTLVQSKDSMGATTTFAATGAHHVIVVALETDLNSTVTALTDNVGNTYVSIAGSRATETADTLAVELWYAADSKAGATTLTPTATQLYGTVMWEVSGLAAASLDHATTLDEGPSSTTPVGAPITTTASGEFVVSVTIVAHMVSGLAAGNPFAEDHRTFGNGWAHLKSATSPPGTYQAQWGQPVTGGYCGSTAAFFMP